MTYGLTFVPLFPEILLCSRTTKSRTVFNTEDGTNDGILLLKRYLNQGLCHCSQLFIWEAIAHFAFLCTNLCFQVFLNIFCTFSCSNHVCMIQMKHNLYYFNYFKGVPHLSVGNIKSPQPAGLTYSHILCTHPTLTLDIPWLN